jgi:hypothetical protein
MKRILIVVVLLVLAAVLGLWRSHGSVRAGLSRVVNGTGDAGSQAASVDEIRKTFQLKPGEKVWIQGINGRVEIQTSDTKTAEVYVKRTGDNANSLQRRQMIVEQNADGLMVRSRQVFNGVWDHLFGHDPKEEVIIKAPRQIALSLKGINAKVYATDIEGPLDMRGLNGRAELGQVGESVSIDGVNGTIVVGLNKLGDRGAQIHGVNGDIELRLAAGLNADLTAKGMNGSVKSEISEVTVEKTDWSRYSARIGNGGSEIEIKGINGNVRLFRSDKPSTVAAGDDKSNSPKAAKGSGKVD